jgi:hypothetical protein
VTSGLPGRDQEPHPQRGSWAKKLAPWERTSQAVSTTAPASGASIEVEAIEVAAGLCIFARGRPALPPDAPGPAA